MEEGYVKRLLRARSEGEEEMQRQEEKQPLQTRSKADSWVLRKKATFESMWVGQSQLTGSTSLICIPTKKEEQTAVKLTKEDQTEAALVPMENVNQMKDEDPVKPVVISEKAEFNTVIEEVEAKEVVDAQLATKENKSVNMHKIVRKEVEEDEISSQEPLDEDYSDSQSVKENENVNIVKEEEEEEVDETSCQEPRDEDYSDSQSVKKDVNVVKEEEEEEVDETSSPELLAEDYPDSQSHKEDENVNVVKEKEEEEVTRPVVTMTEAVSEEEKEPLCREEVKGGLQTVTREEAIR